MAETCDRCGTEGVVAQTQAEANGKMGPSGNRLVETNRGETVCIDFMLPPGAQATCDLITEEPPSGYVWAYEDEAAKERLQNNNSKYNTVPDLPVAKGDWEQSDENSHDIPLTGVHAYDPEGETDDE